MFQHQTINGGNRSGEKVSIATAEECLDRGAIGVSGQINIGEDSEADMIIENRRFDYRFMGSKNTSSWNDVSSWTKSHNI